MTSIDSNVESLLSHWNLEMKNAFLIYEIQKLYFSA